MVFIVDQNLVGVVAVMLVVFILPLRNTHEVHTRRAIKYCNTARRGTSQTIGNMHTKFVKFSRVVFELCD